jgi:hypothetical protein
MTVTAIRKDADILTMTLDAEFDRIARSGVATVGRPTPARALVGPPDVPSNGYVA